MMYPYDVYDLVITVDVLQHPSRAEQLQFFALLLTLIQHFCKFILVYGHKLLKAVKEHY